ncbi:MAG TPA: flagellar biosynthesis protein FliQ [Spirochaetia bacterium]|nr:flagellar biosynthesis protein FliQ [Spirochaetales bacterium]HRY80258.1 flagellar biosynthesis protein FliQ [Spirochaetia bacterium]HRZ89702.1 flagellar biosynthesis protein FliQ [Spirochaetia bacterium]
MDIGDAVNLMRGGILEIVLISAPILIVALVVGLIVSILQATTSIQEQTLTFVPKIASILAVLAILGGWMLTHLAQYTRTLFELIPMAAR